MSIVKFTQRIHTVLQAGCAEAQVGLKQFRSAFCRMADVSKEVVPEQVERF